MPHTTITISVAPDGDLDVKVEFEPEASVNGENPLCHIAAMKAVEAMTEWATS